MRDLVRYIADQITECRKFVASATERNDRVTASHYEGRIDAYERVLGEIKSAESKRWHLQKSNLK